MSAESKLNELLVAISNVADDIEAAFSGTGDLTEQEVTDLVTPILNRLRNIVPTDPVPPDGGIKG